MKKLQIDDNVIIEIFKTNVRTADEAHLLVTELSAHFPLARFNVDLHDVDRVLRMQGPSTIREEVMIKARKFGFECRELD